MVRRHKKEWVHCPECGAHAHITRDIGSKLLKHYCKKCGYERKMNWTQLMKMFGEMGRQEW